MEQESLGKAPNAWTPEGVPYYEEPVMEKAPTITITKNEVNETSKGYDKALKEIDMEQFLKENGISTEQKKEPNTLAGSIGKDITQIPTDVYTGIAKGINETADTIESLTKYTPALTFQNEDGELSFPTITTTEEANKRAAKGSGKETYERPRIPEAERTDKGALGEVVTSISQFATGMVTAGKGLKLLGVAGKAATKGGTIAKGIAMGSYADMLAFDENQKRLSDIIEAIPSLKNPVTQFLSVDKDDSKLLAKVKQGIEAAGLGAAGEALFVGIKAMKGLKKVVEPITKATKPKTADDAIKYIKNQLNNGLDDATSYKFADAVNEVDGVSLPSKLKGKPELSINFERIESPDDIKDLMLAMANDESLITSVTKARRGVVKDTALLKKAGETDAFDTLMKRRVGQPLSDAEVVAARTMHVTAANKLRELAVAASGPQASMADQAAFKKMMAVYHAIQKEVLGARAESARSLRAWSLRVGGDSESTIRQLDDVMTSFGGEEGSKELASRIAAMGDNLTNAQLDVVIEKSAIARTTDAVIEAWTLGLLTNPQTHIVNSTSNFLTGLWIGAERAVEATMGARSAKEVSSYFHGYLGSFKESLLAARNAIKTSEVRVGSKVDLPFEQSLSKSVLDPNNKGGYLTSAISLYGSMLERMSGRLLVAGDAFGKTMLYKAELYSEAAKSGISKGLTGKDLKEFIARSVLNPSKDMDSTALQLSEYATYTSKLGPAGRKYQQLVYEMPMLRFITPFVRTPANIFKFTFERTPLAYFSSSIRNDISKGGSSAAQAHARVALGSATMMIATDWAADGSITGAGPTDPKMRASLRSKGWQPYSIRVNDTYYSYRRFAPISTLLGMGADLGEIMSNYDAYDINSQEEIEELWTASSIAIANQIVGQTFLSGLADTAEMLANPDVKMDQYIQKFAGSVVPAGVAAIERAVSPEMEYVRSRIDAMKARMPYASDSVPKRRDAFGEPISYIQPNEAGEYPTIDRVISLFNPIYTSTLKGDYVVDNILKQGLYIPDITPNQGFALEGDIPEQYQDVNKSVRIDLNEDPKLYEELKIIKNNVTLAQYGDSTYKEALRSLIDGDLGDSYEFNDPRTSMEDKQSILNSISSMYNSVAKEELMQRHPELGGKVMEKLDRTIKSMNSIEPKAQ